MYTVKVKSRKILEGKTALKICAPLLVWMIAEFTTFFDSSQREAFCNYTYVPCIFLYHTYRLLDASKSG